jgi:hypothetical protein
MVDHKVWISAGRRVLPFDLYRSDAADDGISGLDVGAKPIR